MPKILFVDDYYEGFEPYLKKEFGEDNVFCVKEPNISNINRMIEKEKIEVVLLDIKFDIDKNGNSCESQDLGKDLLKKIKNKFPDTPVIMLSSYAREVESEEYNKLAEGTQQKPDNVSNQAFYQELSRKINLLHRIASIADWDEEMGFVVGDNPKMIDIAKRILHGIQFGVKNFLITGENGTGKEKIADAIYGHSNRHGKPFIKVNTSALPETLIESELFGVIPDYPGFHQPAGMIGKFEQADGGTLFLDEIGDISPKTQVALLRVIQDREITRIGGGQPIKVDVVIICATNRNLEQLIKEGKFREDLYYRINPHHIYLPPLRERKEIIPNLYGKVVEKSEKSIDTYLRNDVKEKLMNYDYPGNIRDFENIISRAIAYTSNSPLMAEDIIFPHEKKEALPTSTEGKLIKEFMERIDKEEEFTLTEIPLKYQPQVIREALQDEKGNVKETARKLKTTHGALRRKMSDWGIRGRDFKPKE